MSAIDRQGQMEMNIGKVFIQYQKGEQCQSLDMRRISCRLRLSLLPEMGQRAQITVSETL